MFDWDEDDIGHIANHGITPEEAEEALTIAPLDVTRQYYKHEERFLQIGVTAALRVLAVVTTWRGDLIRVVTAYPAPAAIREYYWQERRGG
jgi:uncharacterized DUF497 family protein